MIDNIKSWACVSLARWPRPSLRKSLKTFFKSALVMGLVAVLVFSQADGAFAARSGGRIGGGSFRAPRPSYSTPSRSRGPSSYSGGYRGGYGGGYYPGGGFGFPFILPFVGFGGAGGLFGIFITIAIANFIIRSFREAGVGGDSVDTYSSNPAVSVAPPTNWPTSRGSHPTSRPQQASRNR